MKESSSLSELMHYLQDVVSTSLERSAWVRAEIAEYRPGRNGHAYLELVEKGSAGITAKVRANLWAKERARLEREFTQATGEGLRSGIKVLVLVRPALHPIYGMSLHIEDMDPSYSQGELARQRQETLLQLKAEGLFEKNHGLPMPILPKRIAVVSSATAAGYGVLCRQLEENLEGFTFTLRLFPAVMQGDAATDSVVGALAAVAQEAASFDVALIIRGGGSSLDLSCFDSIAIGRAIANMPIPVLTGIGHDRDETIADLMAHSGHKTPTAVAEHLLSLLRSAESLLVDRIYDLRDKVEMALGRRKQTLLWTTEKLRRTAQTRIGLASRRYQTLPAKLVQQVGKRIAKRLRTVQDAHSRLHRATLKRMTHEASRLQTKEHTLAGYDPDLALHNGFALLEQDGRWVRKVGDLRSEGELRLTLQDFRTIIEMKKENGQEKDQ